MQSVHSTASTDWAYMICIRIVCRLFLNNPELCCFCCMAVEKWKTALLYSSWSQNFCSVSETDRQRGEKDRLLYWPITSSSLDHDTPGLFSRHHWALLLLHGLVCSTGGPVRRPPQLVLSVSANWHWLTLPPIAPNAPDSLAASAYIIS